MTNPTTYTNSADGVSSIITPLPDGRHKLEVRDDDSGQIIPTAIFLPADAPADWIQATGKFYAGLAPAPLPFR